MVKLDWLHVVQAPLPEVRDTRDIVMITIIMEAFMLDKRLVPDLIVPTKQIMGVVIK